MIKDQFKMQENLAEVMCKMNESIDLLNEIKEDSAALLPGVFGSLIRAFYFPDNEELHKSSKKLMNDILDVVRKSDFERLVNESIKNAPKKPLVN